MLGDIVENTFGYLPQTFDSVDDLLDSTIMDENGEPIDLADADIVAVYGKASG